jgi:CarD-like protein
MPAMGEAPGTLRRGAYTVLVRLAVGDLVVYGGHGVGRVRARQKRLVLGVEVEVVALELAHGLTVTLPIARAQEQLRALANESDLRRVKRPFAKIACLASNLGLRVGTARGRS